MLLHCSWSELKNFSTTRKCPVQYILSDGYYSVVAIDGSIEVVCKIPYSQSPSQDSDQFDFETNFKPSANKVLGTGKDGIITRIAAFHDSDFHRFRGKGFSFIAPANQVSQHAFKITENRSVNGMIPIICGGNEGDSIDVLVADVDNILGFGDGVVLDGFLENWFVDHSRCTQEPIILPYKANILAGLYFKLIYHSVGNNTVKGFLNILLHAKEA